MCAARSDSGSLRLGLSDLDWLTDEQMTRLEPYFPKSHGKPRVDDRRVLSGIILVNRNGVRWRDTPKDYGSDHRSDQRLYGAAALLDALQGTMAARRPRL